MNKVLVSESFSQLNLKIFPFAYSLIFDELQAQQLIIDAISFYVTKNEETLEEFCELGNINDRKKAWFSITKEIYQIVFQIAKKRFDQVRSSLSYRDEDAHFYTLSVIQRASLFLKYKSDFEEVDIIDILDVDYLDYRQIQATADLNLSVNHNGQVLI